MADLLFGVLLFVAILIGWLLGKLESRKRPKNPSSNPLTREYFRGLNLLLNERQDEAMEVFLRTLQVSSDTIETYLVMGSLFRRRGEVDRAIRIHQDLLARPSLDKPQQVTVRFELAKDYLKAGLFDRAERILKEIVDEGGPSSVVCLEYLLSIFEQEKEWLDAIDVAQTLISKGTATLGPKLAHFHCELAEESMKVGDRGDARQHLQKALKADSSCVRASLAMGRLEHDAGEFNAAIQTLRRISQQDPDYLTEALEPLAACYEALEQKDEFVRYLFECLETHPAISVVIALSDQVEALKGDVEGAYVLSEYLKKRPSVKGLNRLIDYHIANAEGAAKENLELLQAFTRQLIRNKPVYRCGHCGFEGKRLHWHCPGCKEWGSIKPIHGLEGE